MNMTPVRVAAPTSDLSGIGSMPTTQYFATVTTNYCMDGLNDGASIATG
jgi:hypothetical protein